MLDQTIILRDGSFCTPVATLRSGQRLVTLIGTIHVGTSQYYRRIQQILYECEDSGSIVTHEGKDWNDTNMYEGLPPGKAELLRLLTEAVTKGFRAWGVVEQWKSVTPRPTWVFTDSMVTELATAFVSNLDYNRIEVVLGDPESYARNFLQGVLDILLARTRFEGTLHTSDFACVNARNQEAIQAILKYAKVQNVASCWGCAHLPGMMSLLEEKGFQCTKIEWLPCLPARIENQPTVG